MILDKAARLFNSRGYFGASMSDLMEATGLEKGGIYNHFQSKEELALEAFDYAVKLLGKCMRDKVEAEQGASNKLLALIAHFGSMVDEPPIPGGCPLMNSAIESDDAHPLMQARVQKAMGNFLGYVESIVVQGISDGQLRAELEPRQVATFIVASLEGALMLSKLYDDKNRMHLVINQMQDYVRSCSI